MFNWVVTYMRLGGGGGGGVLSGTSGQTPNSGADILIPTLVITTDKLPPSVCLC